MSNYSVKRTKPQVVSNTKAPRVLVALSGGIDSAVSAALLLKQGYYVEAAFMKNWSSTTGLRRTECPWLDDRRTAIKVAAHLGIPLHTFDFEKQYEKSVMRYFFKEYKAGRTPNPDVMCNKEIKFKLLYNTAIKMGFDYLATGHYAKVKSGKLLRSSDEFKDQTYFIYNIKQEQLDHILFPIGGLKKSQVRDHARKWKLPNAERKESMGLCFVGKVRLEQFLKQKIVSKPGKILDKKGNVLGKHKGTSFYTLGQRQGLDIGGSGPYYVLRKSTKSNTLVVTDDPKDKELQLQRVSLHSVNWLVKDLKFPLKCQGRFRHQQKLIPLTVIKPLKSKSSGFEVIFQRPQTAVASGQSLVIYQGKTCLGGGVIV